MRDVLLAIVMLGLLPLCLLRPWIGVLVWTWIGLMNPHRLTWEFSNLPIAMFAALLILTGMLFSRDRKPVPWNRELILLAILLAYFTFTSFMAWHPPAAWAYWERVLKMVGMIFVTSMLIYGRERIELLLLVIAGSIGFYGFKGGIFTLLTGGQYRVQGPDGTMIGGNTFLGLAMVMVLPLLFAVARSQSVKWKRLSAYSVSWLTFLAIPFTYSRGALLGLVVVLPGIFPRLRKFLLLIPLLIPIAFLAKDLLPEKLVDRAQTIQSYEEDSSAMQRLRAWSVAINIAKESPLVGAGFDFEEFPDPSRWWSHVSPQFYELANRVTHVAHSAYFSILGQHGVLALLLFIALIIFTLFDLRNIERRSLLSEQNKWISPYARALRIGFLGYLVAGAFISIAYFDLAYLYICLVAIFRREIESDLKSTLSRPEANLKAVPA